MTSTSEKKKILKKRSKIKQLGKNEDITQNEALSFKIHYYEGKFKVIGNMRYRMESHSWSSLHKYAREINIRIP